uniref:Uncharacterized protein n=1 Tax=Oryza glumipatula TaxID=40148 RepID=A0A0D9YQI4_9ORYZ
MSFPGIKGTPLCGVSVSPRNPHPRPRPSLPAAVLRRRRRRRRRANSDCVSETVRRLLLLLLFSRPTERLLLLLLCPTPPRARSIEPLHAAVVGSGPAAVGFDMTVSAPRRQGSPGNWEPRERYPHNHLSRGFGGSMALSPRPSAAIDG